MRASYFALSLVSLALAAPALAQGSGPYGSLGLGVVGAQTGERGDEFAATTALARVGYDIGNYFGVEIEGALGLGGSGQTSTGGPPEFAQIVDFDYAGDAGLFVRGRVPVGDTAELFARAGFGGRWFDRRIENNFGPGQQSIIENGQGDGYLGLGAGVQIGLGASGRDALRLDYTYRAFTVLIEDDANDTYSENAVSLAYVRRF